MIHTAESYFANRKIRLAHDEDRAVSASYHHLPSLDKPAHEWAAFIRHGADHPRPSGKPKKTDAKFHAYISHGRWMVQCPCDEAQYASDEDHFFFCTSCLNKAVDGRSVAVVWPEALERTRIERFLAHRYEKNQNWLPGESIEQLDADNKKNGVTP